LIARGVALLSGASTRCVLLLMMFAPPTSTLFPYTTLFRSERHRYQRPESVAVEQRGLRARRLQRLGPLDRLRLALPPGEPRSERSEEHTSELQSRVDLVCRLLLEKKKTKKRDYTTRRVRAT